MGDSQKLQAMALDGDKMRKKILLKGPLLTRSGYGEQARFALRSLRSRLDLFDIYIQPLQWGKTSWIQEDNEERSFIDQCIHKTIHYIQQGGTFDISLQVTIPNEFQKLAPMNIGYTAGIESTKVSHVWLNHINQMDKIIVVSSHSKHVFETTEYTLEHKETQQQATLKSQVDIEFVNYPVKTYEELPNIDLDLKDDFNFLCVAQFGPRKNLPFLIKSFIEEFKDEAVGLVLKTNRMRNCLMDREMCMHEITNFANSIAPERKCSLYLVHGDMNDEEMHAMYKNDKIKAFACMTHGEGFGLPFFEAAYSGIPVVAPGYSGQNDFLFDENKKEHFYNVAFDLNKIQKEVVWENVLIEDSMWAYPRIESTKDQLRKCYNDVINNSGIASQSNEYAKSLKERFSEEKMYDKFITSILGEGFDEEFDVESWLSEMDAEMVEVE